jgi:hypothetical protein
VFILGRQGSALSIQILHHYRLTTGGTLPSALMEPISPSHMTAARTSPYIRGRLVLVLNTQILQHYQIATLRVLPSNPLHNIMNKLQTLQSALDAREDEILGYQINIDNYIRAIAKIEAEHTDKPAMIEFRDRLLEMLEGHKTEQLKAIIIRDVIADQLAELEVH